MPSAVNHNLRTTPLARALAAARLADGRTQVEAARHIGVGGPKLNNRGAHQLRAEVGLALSLAWDRLDAATLDDICALLPKAEWVSSAQRPTVRKARS